MRGEKGGRKAAMNAACQDLQEQTFSEEATAAPARRQRHGRSDQQWWAWNGDVKMKRNGGKLEAVNCALVDLPAGQYGTQTPVSPEYLASVTRLA